MERRGTATDRHCRVWTATVLDHAEAEAEDLRFWREELTPDQRVVAVEDCLASALAAKGIDELPRLRRVSRVVERPPHIRKAAPSAGFTLIELLLVVLLLCLFVWGIKHCSDDSKESAALPEAEAPVLASSDKDAGVKVVEVILIGLLMAGGIAWQAYLIFEHDAREGPMRVVPAAVAAAVLFLGVLVVSLIEMVDERRSLSFWLAATNVGRALLLGVTLVVKSYLAPVTAAFALSCVVYFFFTYGEMRTIPFVQGVFDWAFSGAPPWISWGYAIVVSIYALGAAIHDSDLNI